jgi:hypothetical protein
LDLKFLILHPPSLLRALSLQLLPASTFSSVTISQPCIKPTWVNANENEYNGIQNPGEHQDPGVDILLDRTIGSQRTRNGLIPGYHLFASLKLVWISPPGD